MKAFAAEVEDEVNELIYIEAQDELADTTVLINHLSEQGVTQIITLDTTDDWLERQLYQACEQQSIERKILPSRLFLTNSSALNKFFKKDKKNLLMDFYLNYVKDL